MKYLQLFEQYKLDKDIQFIIDEILSVNDYDSWEDFLDGQSLGDCQGIISEVSNIIKSNKLKGFKSVFGEIEIIDYARDENDLGKIMTHHWILYKKEILDFSKGTLNEFIDSNDYTSVYADTDALDFNPIRTTNI
jgi:hypothetical protein